MVINRAEIWYIWTERKFRLLWNQRQRAIFRQNFENFREAIFSYFSFSIIWYKEHFYFRNMHLKPDLSRSKRTMRILNRSFWVYQCSLIRQNVYLIFLNILRPKNQENLRWILNDSSLKARDSNKALQGYLTLVSLKYRSLLTEIMIVVNSCDFTLFYKKLRHFQVIQIH